MAEFQSAEQVYKQQQRHRLIKGAVAEAATYRRDLCDQQCGTHLYFKNGMPYEQRTGKRHDCRDSRIGKMWTGHLNLIPIDRIRKTPLDQLQEALDHQEIFNRRWDKAWHKRKETGRIPTTEEVEGY